MGKKIVIAIFLLALLLFELISPVQFNQDPKPALRFSKVENILNIPLKKISSPTASPSIVKKNQTSLIPQASGNQLRIPILMYHYIGNNPNPADYQRDALSITPDKFEEQMKYLHGNGYATISLDTFYAALKQRITLPSKPVILTFDDGYIDFYYNAYPILKSLNLHATVFIPTGLVGQKAYLSWDQIKQMHDSGLITYGAHSVHHYNLPALSVESARYEIWESKKELESRLGIPINFMAYPYGTANSYIMELVKKAGFLGSTGTWPGIIQSEGTIYNMPRLRIVGDIDLPAFISKL